MAKAVSRFVRMFEEAQEASQAAREEAERARDYYDGNQLTAEELKALRRRKQPPVIENLIRPKIDYLCGLERQTRTDPACYPRTLQDDEAAQVATDVLRYVADDQKLDIKRSKVFENMLCEGFGGVEIGAVQRRGVIDPEIVHIAWERLFFDPHSRQGDFSDAKYLGYITWMDADEAKERWQGKEEIIDQTSAMGASVDAGTYEDRPKWKYWADRARNRVLVVTMYHKAKGAWERVVYTLAGDLEESGPSPFIDEDGKPECALILQSAYVDRENDRYGIVRDLFTLQDEVNKRRSKFLHLVNTRQIRASRAFEGDTERLRKEVARPDGVIIADEGEFEIVGTGDLSMGHFNLLNEAKAAIQGTGPNAHLQGREGNSQSGRAILAMQQGGMTEMAPLLDALRDFNMRVFRSIWNRVRQFWQGERWVRITDDENAIRFSGVNVPQAALAMQKIKKALEEGKIDQDMAGQYAQQVQSDPMMMQPANVLADLDVDIQIDEVQNTPTLHAEQFEQLVNLASSGMMQIPPELIIRASNLRDKQRLLDVLKEQQEGAAQAGQQQQELQQRAMLAEVSDKEAGAANKAAQAELNKAKTEETYASIGHDEARLQLDAMNAGTRMAGGSDERSSGQI